MINSQKTFVAFLDILGYGKIVENVSPEDFYNSIVSTSEKIQELIDSFSINKIEPNVSPTTKHSAAELVKTVGFEILSDTVIIYWDFNDIELINKKYYKEIDNELTGIFFFLSMVSSFIFFFIPRTGHLLRGSVCLGKFYKRTFDSCLLNGEFIFSEALVRGYKLEQLANHPRILVDETLYNLWESKVDKLGKGLINRDKDGKSYFDFYEVLRTFTVDAKKNWLASITRQVNNMLTVKQDDKHVWKKWYWFKEYHNEKIRSFCRIRKPKFGRTPNKGVVNWLT